MEILNATTFSPRNPIIHHPQSHVCSWTQVFDTMSGEFSPLAYFCLPRRRNMGWRFGERWMWRDLLVKCVASLISLLSQRHFRIGNSFQVLFSLVEELCQGFLSLSLFILATRVAQLINSDQCQTVTAREEPSLLRRQLSKRRAAGDNPRSPDTFPASSVQWSSTGIFSVSGSSLPWH